MGFRIGQGIDFHRFGGKGPCIIGGAAIEHPTGLLGHSDADVLTHAICDGMLGALALGDIGTHFPDTDPAYRSIDSQILLKHCSELIQNKGYGIVNIDATLVCELPKISPHRTKIIDKLANTLSISSERISIKATTSEKMGAMGREEGIAASVIVLLEALNSEAI